jgi:uncharacterized membrane protein YkoI
MKIYTFLLATVAASVIGCNQSVQTASDNFNALPPAVQKTVRAQSPNGEIASINKTTQDGREVYQVEFREDGKNPKILVAPDGTLVSSEMAKPAGAIQRLLTPTGATGTPFSALPEAAQKTIKAHAPDTEISSISRHEDNNRVVYEVTFKEPGKNPSLKVAEDGSLVQDLQK